MIHQIDATGYDLTVDPPQECIEECSAGGDVLPAVQYWVGQLEFSADVDGTRAYLQSTGGWELDELQDHATNLERLLWIVCCDIRELRELSESSEEEGGDAC